MKVGSLFAGIGGFDLAAERCGMEIAWQVEIDEWCRRVLAKHWPDVPKYGDIREIEELPYVDLIAGGFPCQPVSLAGKGLAQDDERWLWPEFERIIRMVRPRYVVVENVPGLLGRGMGDVLGGLSACGYDAEWERLPASAFGAPHRRDRIWIVAYPTSISTREQDNETHAFPKSGETWEIPECRAWWKAEPRVRRVAYGVPGWDDRIRGLGSAIVPQVAEWIFRRIIAYEAHRAA